MTPLPAPALSSWPSARRWRGARFIWANAPSRRNEARVEKLEATYLDAAGSGEAATPEALTRLATTLADYRTARLAAGWADDSF